MNDQRKKHLSPQMEFLRFFTVAVCLILLAVLFGLTVRQPISADNSAPIPSVEVTAKREQVSSDSYHSITKYKIKFFLNNLRHI